MKLPTINLDNMGKTAQEIIDELKKVKPKTKLRTKPKITGVPIDSIKDMKIRDVKRLTRELKLQ